MRRVDLKWSMTILTPRNFSTAVPRAILTALAIACAGQAAASPTEIVIEGENTFPENITSTRDGTIITGSVGSGGIFKAAPGFLMCAPYIRKAHGGRDAPAFRS